MVAALVFLYDRTQALDLNYRNQILTLLRELSDIDNRWDVDVCFWHVRSLSRLQMQVLLTQIRSQRMSSFRGRQHMSGLFRPGVGPKWNSW